MDNNMPEQNNHCNNCAMCQGKSCCGGHCHGHRHFILRWILGLIILGIVFCMGVKIGEFKSETYGGSFGSGHMRRMMPNYYYGTQPMMYQSWGVTNSAPSATGPVATPSTSTKTPAK